MMKKRGLFRKEPLEDVTRENMIWMPYHRIRFNYTRSERSLIQRCGETGRGETALNAMFCGAVKSERELFMLFRPNYLKHELLKYSPKSEEIVGPTFYTDFDAVLKGFVKKLNEAGDELTEVRSELQKSRVHMRRSRIIMPAILGMKKERTLSEKVAKLSATKNTLSMCLNVNEDVNSIKVTNCDIFYYPTLVVTLKNEESGTEKYLLVNLVESGLTGKHLDCDEGLTELCSMNSGCKDIVTRSITPHALRA